MASIKNDLPISIERSDKTKDDNTRSTDYITINLANEQSNTTGGNFVLPPKEQFDAMAKGLVLPNEDQYAKALLDGTSNPSDSKVIGNAILDFDKANGVIGNTILDFDKANGVIGNTILGSNNKANGVIGNEILGSNKDQTREQSKPEKRNSILWYGILLNCGTLLISPFAGFAFLFLPLQTGSFALIPFYKKTHTFDYSNIKELSNQQKEEINKINKINEISKNSEKNKIAVSKESLKDNGKIIKLDDDAVKALQNICNNHAQSKTTESQTTENKKINSKDAKDPKTMPSKPQEPIHSI